MNQINLYQIYQTRIEKNTFNQKGGFILLLLKINCFDNMLKKIKKLHDIGSDEEEPILASVSKNGAEIGKIDQETNSSVLFEGYRSLGYYASDLPFSVVKSDQDYLLATAIGEHAFYVYDTKHLNLAYMSRYVPETILYLEATSDGFVYTALQDPVTGRCHVVCWKKMHRVAVFDVPGDLQILKIMIVGDFIFTLCSDSNFIVFDRRQPIQNLESEGVFDEGKAGKLEEKLKKLEASSKNLGSPIKAAQKSVKKKITFED